MKKIITIIIVVLALAIVLSTGKDIIAKMSLSGWINANTETKVTINNINIGIIRTLVGVKGLKLFNPPGFPEKLMADFPELYVNYSLLAFLRRRIHLEEVRLNLKELIVIKNESGKVNVDSLKVTQDIKKNTGSSSKKQIEIKGFQIDLLKLKIGKVIFKDYSKGPEPTITEYNVDIDEQFKNIMDPYSFVALLITRSLSRTPIARLADINLTPLKTQASRIMGTSAKAARRALDSALEKGKELGAGTEDTVKQAAEKAKRALQKFLPKK